MAATAAMKKCSCPGCQQQPRSSPQKIDPSVGEGGPPKVRNLSSLGTSLSKPLFVDCSVEYELPMVPKIPPDSQPLLVIHPGWQQKRRITRSSSQLMAERNYIARSVLPLFNLSPRQLRLLQEKDRSVKLLLLLLAAAIVERLQNNC